MNRGDAVERFWLCVDKGPGCWLWNRSTDTDGYGLFTTTHGEFGFQGRQSRASRVSWVIHNGPIPEKMCVLHEYDNPTCIKPTHLFLGTHKQNMEDASHKKRFDRAGSKNGRATVDESFVKKVRLEYNPRCKRRGMAALVKKYNIPQGTLQKIIYGSTWK